MAVTLYRAVMPIAGNRSPLSRFPKLQKQQQALQRHLQAATPAALTALERTFSLSPALTRAMIEGNYAELRQLGFRFEKLAESDQRILSLNGEGLRLQHGKFVYDELRSSGALLRFHDQWHSSLREERQELWDLWNTAPVGYHILNAQGIITAVNQTEAKLLGYTPDEMFGEQIFNFIHPKQRSMARRRYRQKLSGKVVPPVQDRTYICKDGTALTMSARDSLLRDKRGRGVGVKTVLVDISKIRELEREVFRLIKQDELGQLAAGFAHEFGNLIMPILCSSQAVRRMIDERTKPDAAKHLDNVIDAALTAQKVVEEIRDYAKTSTNNDMTSRIDPRNVTQQVIRLAKDSVKKDGDNVRFRLITQNQWHIEAIEHQVFQTIFNLCLNALDALSGSGQVSIQIKDQTFQADHKTTAGQVVNAGNYVAISVRDNGIGIQPNSIQEIFDPFFTTKEFSDNTGLGLAVLLRIMDLHGGGVDLVSKPGHGSKFTVYFPAIVPDNGDNNIS